MPCSLAILNAAYAHDKTMLAKAVGLWTAAFSSYNVVFVLSFYLQMVRG